MDWAAVNYAQWLVNGLAVGGAFLVGYLLGGGLAWWVDKSFTAGRSPRGLRTAAKYLGGVALAVFVALLLFGRGGAGLGGGIGDGFGSGTGRGNGSTATGAAPVSADVVVPHSTAKVARTVRVVVLGGADVVAGKFYRVGDDPVAKTLADAKAAVLAARSSAGDNKLGIEIVFPETNALDPYHPAVTAFATWVRDTGLTVTFPAGGP